jgi:hypothetical protein
VFQFSYSRTTVTDTLIEGLCAFFFLPNLEYNQWVIRIYRSEMCSEKKIFQRKVRYTRTFHDQYTLSIGLSFAAF